jgi:hypothetical protein
MYKKFRNLLIFSALLQCTACFKETVDASYKLSNIDNIERLVLYKNGTYKHSTDDTAFTNKMQTGSYKIKKNGGLILYDYNYYFNPYRSIITIEDSNIFVTDYSDKIIYFWYDLGYNFVREKD